MKAKHCIEYSLAIGLSFLLAVGMVNAQEGSIEISEKAVLEGGASVAYLNLNGDNVSGIQFQVHYPEGVKLDISGCLDGVPETHLKTFTTCKDFPERNLMLVVISDIGESRPLPPGLLGAALLNGGSADARQFRVSDVVALDTNGNKIVEGVNDLISLEIE